MGGSEWFGASVEGFRPGGGEPLIFWGGMCGMGFQK